MYICIQQMHNVHVSHCVRVSEHTSNNRLLSKNAVLHIHVHTYLRISTSLYPPLISWSPIDLVNWYGPSLPQ